MSPSLPDRTTRTSAGLLLLLSYVSLVSPTESPTSPPPPGCSSFLDCDSCVPHAKCLWCFATNSCSEYPVTWLLPPASLCPLSQARWGVCWVNFEALIIAMAVVLGTIIISIIICCCCCCCRRRTRPAGPDRDEETFSRRREEIRQRAEERKAERKTRNDEIRRKYGLMGDSDHPYSKFENE
ncbi:PREDICTED: pituitary tumor-transforming gene 1 protein-interacting protein-like [Cyprinodon variegatus]|uniref:pituitary tumor-transforming gene 1 protein-interacting protein-like n=1 Tax=Cyprinodon variegatus TaxID=28743 RepID=UPI00074296B7|nr:PREDICTED: pituitary tumor-transforming gene 1 protein-interacting protein-like [Cyprinodon variegatus]